MLGRKWLPVLVGGVIAAALVGLGVSLVQQKTYEAKATLIVGQSLSSSNPDYSGLLVSQQLATTFSSIAATRSQLEAVIDQLGLATTPEELARRVDASAIPGSSLLAISAEDTDPKRAAAVANALATRLVAETSHSAGRAQDFQASLEAALSATQAQIASTETQVQQLLALDERTAAQEALLTTLQAQLVTLRSAYATMLGMTSSAGATNTLAIVDPAVAPAEPVSPRPALNALVAALLGLLAAAGVAGLAEYRNDTVGEGKQVERLAGATVLATVGVLRPPEGWGAYPLATVVAPRSRAAEAYRTLRANLEFAAVDHGLSTLLVTSAEPGEGKTMTAANIAVTLAQAGRRVLLIDADLRLPSVHTAFAVRNEMGLTTALVVEAITLDRLVQKSGQPNLWVLSSGPLPPNPAELLSSHRMRALLDAATAAYDVVVLDSSPIAAVTDAALLGAAVTATLLVVDSGRGKRRSLAKAREQLDRAGASVIGVVINRDPASRGLDDTGQYGGYLRPATEPTAASSGKLPAGPQPQSSPLWGPGAATGNGTAAPGARRRG